MQSIKYVLWLAIPRGHNKSKFMVMQEGNTTHACHQLLPAPKPSLNLFKSTLGQRIPSAQQGWHVMTSWGQCELIQYSHARNDTMNLMLSRLLTECSPCLTTLPRCLTALTALPGCLTALPRYLTALPGSLTALPRSLTALPGSLTAFPESDSIPWESDSKLQVPDSVNSWGCESQVTMSALESQGVFGSQPGQVLLCSNAKWHHGWCTCPNLFLDKLWVRSLSALVSWREVSTDYLVALK